MVIQTDRTTKFLLIIIALLLGILVVRPMWRTAPAFAADTRSTTTSSTIDTRPFSYRLTEVGNILIPSTVTVREMQVIDSTGGFLLRMNDKINVYRMEKYYLPLNSK